MPSNRRSTTPVPRPAEPDAVLQVASLVKTFGGVRAVDGISFQVDPGEIVSLIGPNGAGKTTCLNMIAGTMAPNSGTIRLGSQQVQSLSAAARYRAGMRRTFQHPSFPADSRVGEWLFVDKAIRTTYRHRGKSRLVSDFAAAAPTDNPDGPINRLSPGQRHLVELARVCLGNPLLLLLDEPTSGMDAREVEIFTEMIRGATTPPSATLLVTHDVRLAAELSNRIVVMNFGAVIAQGAPSTVLREPAVVDSYLGPRSARRLFGSAGGDTAGGDAPGSDTAGSDTAGGDAPGETPQSGDEAVTQP